MVSICISQVFIETQVSSANTYNKEEEVNYIYDFSKKLIVLNVYRL